MENKELTVMDILVRRIRNMLDYGESKENIVATLTKCGATMDEIYLAYKAAKLLGNLG